MTITLHWWFVPVILFVAGAITSLMSNDEGMGLSASGCLVIFFWMAAVFIVIGHYL